MKALRHQSTSSIGLTPSPTWAIIWPSTLASAMITTPATASFTTRIFISTTTSPIFVTPTTTRIAPTRPSTTTTIFIFASSAHPSSFPPLRVPFFITTVGWPPTSHPLNLEPESSIDSHCHKDVRSPSLNLLCWSIYYRESTPMDPSPAVGGEIVDAAEMKKVAQMRALVEAKDTAAKEEDDLMLRRFLRARDLDIEKGSSLFLKYLEWKRHSVPNGYISKSEVQNELAHKKVFLQGFDKQQRPIAVVFAARHYSSKRDIEEFKRLSVHVLDELCSRMPRGQEKFICIGDLQGWGYSNCDIRAYLASLDIMQSYYPERLGKVFLIHVPYIFMKAWKIIYPLIDKNTKKKFVFVDDKKLKETLLEDIDESQLPEIYGGKLPLCPVGDSSD